MSAANKAVNSTESLLLHSKRPQIAVDGIGIKIIIFSVTTHTVRGGGTGVEWSGVDGACQTERVPHL